MSEETSFEEEIRQTEAFIDEQFTNSLKNEILEEIKTFVSKTVRDELEFFNPRHEQSSFTEKTKFINHLKKEVDFLRKQLENRDDIIYSLLQEKSYTNQNTKKDTQNDEFRFPKDPVKPINNTQMNQMTLKNRYETLFVEESDNENFITSEQNENITLRKSRNKNENRNKNTDNSNNNRKTVAVVGDSMIKYIKGFKLSNKNKKVVVKTFPGARVDCMKHYIRPTLDKKPDTMIIHCGTNDLQTKKPDEITENIVMLAKMVSEESENTSVIVSEIVPRGDALNRNVDKLNETLQKRCNECNIGFIDNSNIDPVRHLNNSKLHLNIHGTNELQKNLQEFIDC
ncbi:dual specificity protein phosphatase YVH1-like [Clytia hemisphaerica]|uniref:dual specificity protein phosphatase YVH1-like n=1 Tax=Clytia hemisphaerica TaxID=252671 RepID=UPI0034D469AA